MRRKYFTVFATTVAIILTQVSGSWLGNTYRGAVVEYNPVHGKNDQETMNENVKNYVNFIQQAASKEAEIIVFPEQGLMTNIRSRIPDPSDKIAPCEGYVTTKAVKDLSCASRKYKIYTVVNLLEERSCDLDDEDCPPVGYYNLNTNVVFDRNGVVIARYSKYNIYGPGENRTKDPEFVFFDTDFGVRFGTFVCFDVLFSVPAQRLVQQFRLTDFVFTSKWYSELPFLTALQVQRGWAETHNVNLLSSGVNYPMYGSSGSGIYNGKFGHLAQVMPETSKSKLLIADIPKINAEKCSSNCYQKETRSSSPFSQTSSNSADFPPKPEDATQPDFALMREDLKPYTTQIITPGNKFEETICSREDFCCQFNVNMEALTNETSQYTWRAMAFNGVRKFGASHFLAVQSCGVVACKGPDVQNCTSRAKNIPGLFRFTEISIKGNFKLRNSFQMPTTLTDGRTMEPLPAYKYEFLRTDKENSAEVSLNLLWPVTDLYSFGIWGRDFSGDGIKSAAGAAVSIPVILVALFGFLLFAR